MIDEQAPKSEGEELETYLLKLVNDELPTSIGFDFDADLTDQREMALEYYKGQMRDVPAMPNRSKAVSMDVRDGIQAILPDLMDIFTGTDEVLVFSPRSEDDVEQAQQETEYLQHVIFNENDGWRIFYEWFLDALQAKTGVVKYGTDEGDTPKTEEFEGKTASEVELLSQEGEIIKLEPCDDLDEMNMAGEPLYDVKIQYPQEDGRVWIMNVAPEDITVGRDTIKISDATYCAVRARPRAQDLIADGIDKAKVDMLSSWSPSGEEAEQQARDTVDETVQTTGPSVFSMRQVEVIEHYIRILDKDGERLFCVLTGGNDASQILLRYEEIGRIPLAVITPYIVSHRFYGNSVADFLMDIQRIKSTLQRMTLDSGYFALNQRVEVSEADSGEDTVEHLLRNEPGVPVVSKTGNAIRPIPSPGLGFDTLSHLEYFSTVAEERTGIVRGAQGLNPDTLHDTASGAMALLSRAQKRIRLIARTFAETGVKDLFLGVHALLRQNASKARIVRLRGKWVPVNPSEWSSRENMSIEIGRGAGNEEHNIAAMNAVAAMQAQIVQAQGGTSGPIVKMDQIYATATKTAEQYGIKAPEKFFADPEDAPPAPPQPDPAQMAAEAKMQMEQEKLQIDQANNQAKMVMDQEKAANDYQLQVMKIEADTQLKREQLMAELDLKREQLAAELELKREQMAAEMALKIQFSNAGDTSVSSDVNFGGEPG
jgi:hypothetical protein